MSPRVRLGWLAGYAAVTFLSFPQRVGALVIDLGPILAWLGPVLLVMGVSDRAPRAAIRDGGAAGLAAYSAILYWIFVVTVTYGHAPVAVGVLAPVALALYIALFPAAFAGGIAWLAARGAANAWTAALLWTAVDHARSFFLTGFPWATLGYAQLGNPLLRGLAAWTGVYGLSFASVLGGVAALEAWAGWRRGERIPTRTWAALAIVASLHLVGPLTAREPAAAGGPTLRIAALQGNIDQGVKWSAEWADRTLAIYEDLSRRAAENGAQVIVWPETAVPGAIEANGNLEDRLERLARETNAVYIVGGVGLEYDAAAGETRYLDSAFLLDPRGGFGGRYDKSHLVPFGEYVPFRDLLGSVLGAVARGMAIHDVAAGPGPYPMEITPDRGRSRELGSVLVGIPICYELLFPDLVRRFVRDGASVLLAITNDAWYGRTGAPYQFLAITAMRSAETGVWTVRAANTGVSAIIDASGSVVAQTEIFERDWVMAEVPVSAAGTAAATDDATFYVRYGDAFVWGCWLGVVAVCAWARRAGERRADRPAEPDAGTHERPRRGEGT